ncbi:MAG: OmpA family protein [Gammaproteobacteria bacterium]|nr:OmpA family protein [Gammaproteobacteria bacterium]
MRLLIVSLLLLFSHVSANAGTLHYEATLEDSVWEVSSSPLKCTLTHPVKLFGKAQFYQLAGYQPKFRFYVDQVPVRKGKVSLSSIAPEWKNNEKPRDLGDFKYQKGETPFRYNRKMSLRLMSELEQGMTPIFYFKDWGDGRDDVSAVLSPVRYRESLGEFRACMGQIIPYDFKNVRNTMVNFDSAKFNLSKKARRDLDGAIAYLTRDPSVIKANVNGHTDSRGTHTYNNTLSQQRALAVRKYLIDNGVSISKLSVKYFGKRKPLGKNMTQKGRASNRRVWVELIR